MSSILSYVLPLLQTPPATPCDGCHAGCCRAYVAPLTGRDIFRIVTELKIPFWRFVSRWADQSCEISQGVAPHFFFDDDRQTPYVIGLLQNESQLFPGTRKCVFLEESPCGEPVQGGTGRCSIYEQRPVDCRVFPARLNAAGQLAVQVVTKPALESRHDTYRLCPRSWNIANLDRVSALQNLQKSSDEMELFQTIANRWNEDPGPWPLFPDFLELIYTALTAA